MQIEDRVGLTAEQRAALERELAPLASLHDLIRWGLPRGWIVSAVVVQDEYTHDVVMPVGEGRVLVFDST
ncbi:MAG TPA: hypothetical protein VFU21_10635 [Kofleriaceae bacterium]|nr:hypothetical protein [Kofleriaceae bacterium]